MKDKNSINKTLLLVILCVVHILVSAVIRSVLFLPAGIISAAYVFSPYPGTPDVKYVEIPIEITYETDSNKECCTDVVVCEYEGWTVVSDVNKESVWSEHLKSGNSGVALAEKNGVLLCAEYGKAENYINTSSEEKIGIKLFTYDTKNCVCKTISHEEAYIQYGVKNIKLGEVDTAIVNYHNSFSGMLATKIR